MLKRTQVTAFPGEVEELAEIDVAKLVGPYGWGIMEHAAKTFPCPPCAEEGTKLVQFDRDFVELKLGKKPQDPGNFLKVLEEAQQLAEKRGIFTRAGIKRVLGPFADLPGNPFKVGESVRVKETSPHDLIRGAVGKIVEIGFEEKPSPELRKRGKFLVELPNPLGEGTIETRLQAKELEEIGGAKVRLEQRGSHVSGTIEGSPRQIAKAVETIGETVSNPGKRAGRPFGLTECEKKNPGVVAKIIRCSTKVAKDPSISSPVAVCRASIPCP